MWECYKHKIYLTRGGLPHNKRSFKSGEARFILAQAGQGSANCGRLLVAGRQTLTCEVLDRR